MEQDVREAPRGRSYVKALSALDARCKVRKCVEVRGARALSRGPSVLGDNPQRNIFREAFARLVMAMLSNADLSCEDERLRSCAIGGEAALT